MQNLKARTLESVEMELNGAKVEAFANRLTGEIVLPDDGAYDEARCTTSNSSANASVPVSNSKEIVLSMTGKGKMAKNGLPA